MNHSFVLFMFQYPISWVDFVLREARICKDKDISFQINYLNLSDIGNRRYKLVSSFSWQCFYFYHDMQENLQQKIEGRRKLCSMH